MPFGNIYLFCILHIIFLLSLKMYNFEVFYFFFYSFNKDCLISLWPSGEFVFLTNFVNIYILYSNKANV